jgi:L-alanine-DL-glutamate epimerase-like enolase superfamily enzyme
MIASLTASVLRIPFRTTFRHASASRDTTQAIWVEARSGGGLSGYGEGCPREYVTGEDLASARAFLETWDDDLRRLVVDFASLRNWVVGHAAIIDRHPAAWAAAECAILDLLGHVAGCSVEKLLGLPDLCGDFQYTAVIGDAEPEAFATQLAQYRKAGFNRFKIKISGDVARDSLKVAALVAAGIAPAMVRIDANNLWPDADTAIDALSALEYPCFAVEEPLRPGDYAGMLRIAQALDTHIILDESLLRSSQLDDLGGLGVACVVNLRVSKMGGVLRSLELLQALREREIPVIVGAHVGESSVLTRAALTVAAAAGEHLLAQEGAFGTHLLQHDVAKPPLMFGPGGVLSVASAGLKGSGWGLNIIQEGLVSNDDVSD